MKSIIIIQVLIAFIAGLSSLFLLYRLLNSFMRKRFGIEETNTAFAIFQVGILLSGSLIMSSVLSAAVNAIKFLNQGSGFDIQNLMTSLAYVLIFLILGIIFTLVLIASGIFAFFQITHVNVSYNFLETLPKEFGAMGMQLQQIFLRIPEQLLTMNYSQLYE
jgi:hypothetical protein